MTKFVVPYEAEQQLVATSQMEPKHVVKIVRMILQSQETLLTYTLQSANPHIVPTPLTERRVSPIFEQWIQGFNVFEAGRQLKREMDEHVARSTAPVESAPETTEGELPNAEMPPEETRAELVIIDDPVAVPPEPALQAEAIDTTDVTQTSEYQDQPSRGDYDDWLGWVETEIFQRGMHRPSKATPREFMQSQPAGMWQRLWKQGHTPCGAVDQLTTPRGEWWASGDKAPPEDEPQKATPLETKRRLAEDGEVFINTTTGEYIEPRNVTAVTSTIPIGEYINQVKTMLRLQQGWGDRYIDNQDWSIARWAGYAAEGLTPEQAAAKIWTY